MYPRKLTRQVISDPDYPVVETKAGKLRGLVVEGAFIFRGIKYAKAKRFHLPEPVEPWEGVKEAIIYGPVSPEFSTGIANDEYNVPHFHYPQDEDCQYINVWTQSIDRNAKKPVMVWIHGGQWVTGSGIELYAYDGEEISAWGDVVFVSLNHRLNVIGYTDFGKYGDEYKYSGNAGLADLVMALEWVRDNIEAFGGDPNNVTIMGQSGGGGKVRALFNTPAADGLYHKAIIQSGAHAGDGDGTLEESQYLAERILAHLNIAPENVKTVEKVPYYKLARAATEAQKDVAEKFGHSFMWGAVKDDEYFLGQPVLYGWRPEVKNIPLIIGTCLGEFDNNYARTLIPKALDDWTEEEKAEQLKAKYGDKADAVVEAFKKAYPGRNTAGALFIGDWYRLGAYEVVARRVKDGCAPTYNYLLTLMAPLNKGTVPWHNMEEAYVFHNAQYLEASYIPGVSEELQDIMTGAWVAFAKTGDPNHAGMPIWHPEDGSAMATMIFDRDTHMVYDHDKELMSFFSGVRATGPRAAVKLGGGPRQSL